MNFLGKKEDKVITTRNNVEVPVVEPEEPIELENSDETCCHRITCCCPFLREIIVTQPILKCAQLQITWADLFWLITCIIITAVTYLLLYCLIGPPVLPGGSIFGLFVIIVSSYFLGWTLTYIPYLQLPPVVTSKIRLFCMAFITLRIGLQLTTSPLREHPVFVMALALVPCSMEMLSVSVCAKYLLGYPWNWAFLTGTIVACMSPVVTVNCILALAEQGYGEDKGIATLLCTASSIDDVHIVAIYSFCFSTVFSHDELRTEWWSYIPGGIRDFILSFIAGTFLGTIFIFFPHRNHKYALHFRLVSLAVASLMFALVVSKISVTGGGFFASVIMSFVASSGWRIISAPFDLTPFRKSGYIIWHLMQPVLVGVIGADIDFHDWSFDRFGLHLTCIFIGLTIRSIFAIFSTIRTPFTYKERIFIALSWLPKGTLQAALAPLALEQARSTENRTDIETAIDVVRLSVVAIVFLAPLGAIIMMAAGPMLLNQITAEEQESKRRLSYLRIVSLQPVIKRKNHVQSSS
ncbi:sodium/hydrogen exchanger 9B1-like isoform X2 [Belonocnema kinseyi]|uniref:sodium/hydrogen exchanger 9B1-like isoform X2 n=1 Tax=Belonocnema kinseyi TaxID=2817044 RepID=UPI00143D0335|nr:sodium/hydrogen exchanger 9B1-like isoform X2 [Belonocnema kinseyi]